MNSFDESWVIAFRLLMIVYPKIDWEREPQTVLQPSAPAKEPRGTGESADTLPDLEKQLDEYYRFRGWSREGLPTDETLERLGLERL